MSTEQFPSFPGQTFDIGRTALWKARKPASISGKEVSISDWSYPAYQWKLTWELLRQGLFLGTTWSEMQQLMGFFNARQGGFDSFLYTDPDDNAVTNQIIGYTDGVNSGYQAYRTFGEGTEPIFAITAITALSVGGTALVGPFAFNAWGYTGTAGGPGYIFLDTGTHPAGEPIVASFSYSYPCRFVADQCEFQKFRSGSYKVDQLTFKSIK